MKDTEPLTLNSPRHPPPPHRLHPLLFPLLTALCVFLVFTQATSFFFLLTRLESVRSRLDAAEMHEGRQESFLSRELKWLKTRVEDLSPEHSRRPATLSQHYLPAPPHPPPLHPRDAASRVRRRAADTSYGVRDAVGEVASEDGELSVQLQDEETEKKNWLQLTSYARIPYNAIKEFCSRTRESCPPGPMGPEGALGPVGPSGDTGNPGDVGERGDRGLPGQPGLVGLTGMPGPVGPPGQRGPKGEKGKSGGLGLDGRDGLPGEPGLDGIPGRNGLDGIPGVDGMSGNNGTPGMDGLNGTDGIPGSKGDKGDSGVKGNRGISGPRGRKGRNGIPGLPGQPGIQSFVVNDTEHMNRILTPPSIPGSTRQRPRQRQPIIVREGDNLRLRCHPDGKPAPTVVWSMENGDAFPTGRWKDVTVGNRVLNLTNISRQNTGVYLCLASNGVPADDYKTFPVEVHFQPYIRVNQWKVGSHNGSIARLECNLESLPVAVSFWEDQQGRILENSTKYRLSHEQNINIKWKSVMRLTINNIETSDYGTYYCVAKNELSMTRGRVVVEEINPNLHRPSTGTEDGLSFGPDPPDFEGFDDLCPKCPLCPKCGEVLFTLPVEEYVTNETYPGYEHRHEGRMITAVGKPVFHRHTASRFGSWMRDTHNDQDARYWTTDPSNSGYLYEFENKIQFRKNVPIRNYTLAQHFVGNSHVIFNGSFYYQVRGHQNISRLELATNQITTTVIPGLIFSGDHTLYENSQDYIDLNADVDGLWAIYSPAPHDHTVVRKMDPRTLKVEYSWKVSLNHKNFGNFFMAYGVLYAVESAVDRDTRIRIAMDLYNTRLLNVNLPFNNPFRDTTMLGYNYKAKIIYSWDKGNQLTYPVRESGMGFTSTPPEAAPNTSRDYEEYEVEQHTSS